MVRLCVLKSIVPQTPLYDPQERAPAHPPLSKHPPPHWGTHCARSRVFFRSWALLPRAGTLAGAGSLILRDHWARAVPAASPPSLLRYSGSSSLLVLRLRLLLPLLYQHRSTKMTWHSMTPAERQQMNSSEMHFPQVARCKRHLSAPRRIV
jgi:hypothetical protein